MAKPFSTWILCTVLALGAFVAQAKSYSMESCEMSMASTSSLMDEHDEMNHHMHMQHASETLDMQHGETSNLDCCGDDCRCELSITSVGLPSLSEASVAIIAQIPLPEMAINAPFFRTQSLYKPPINQLT